MKNKIKILDASAFIGGYHPTDKNNYTIPEVTQELKDIQSQSILNNALKDDLLKIQEPNLNNIKIISDTIKKSGDVLRLSDVDKKLLALSIQKKSEHNDVLLLTDDYSIQNVAKILKIPFQSIITNGINQIYSWKLICKGCKKEYSKDYPYPECEICGSSLYKKRIKE